jgi:glutaminyl-peptide cyclotransferase
LISALNVRHLAERWESTYLPDTHAYHSSYLATRRYDPTPSILSTIENLVLLDLLGAVDPHISSYSKRTHWLFKHLADVEDRLEELSREGLPNKGKGKGKWFEGFGWAGAIDDDHRPVSRAWATCETCDCVYTRDQQLLKD